MRDARDRDELQQNARRASDDRDEDAGAQRDAAEDRSRGVLRAMFPGADAERHAELDAKRAAKKMPYARQLERAFGRSFDDVQAHTGMAAELAPLGAQALTDGNVVAFADEEPSEALAAHEATHVVQNRQAGAAQPMAAGVVAPRASAAEGEADAIAGHVAEHGLDAPLPPVQAAPAGHVHLAGMGDVRLAEAAAEAAEAAARNHVTAEPQLRAILDEPVRKNDIPKIQRRIASLVSLFQSIPTSERPILKRRLTTKSDELYQVFHGRLSTKFRWKLIDSLDGEAVAVPTGADSVEMESFATTIDDARFVTAPDELILDQAWKKSGQLAVIGTAGFGPPAGEPVTIEWRLKDRLGEVVQSGTVAWAAAIPAPPPFVVSVDQAGRWDVAIEVVDDGRVIGQANRTLKVRSAAEDGSDLPAVLADKDVDRRVAAASMSNADLQAQITATRAQLGTYELGGVRPEKDDNEIASLRDALRELEFVASQRSVDGEPLATGDAVDPDSFDMQTVREAPWVESPAYRATIQQKIDALIAKYGLAGAEAHINELEQQLADDDASIHGGTYGSRVDTWLHAEFDARKEEATAFLERYDLVGRNIAHGMLVASEGKLQAELERYGLKATDAPHGSYGGNGAKPGADLSQLKDAIDQARMIMEAHDRASKLPSGDPGVEQAWKEFEAAKIVAIAKHPMLRPFLEGNTQNANWAPTGTVPNMLSLTQYDPDVFAPHMGWELNKKLADNRTTQENISGGTLSIFASPEVIRLTSEQMRVAPGTMLDGAIWERHREAMTLKGSDNDLLIALTVALGLLLAIPSGGTSMVASGVVLAGEVTLLAADLYLLGKDFEEREVFQQATNTDMSVADSLLQEEPAAGPLIFRILGILGPGLGAAGVAKAGSQLARVAQAREGIEAVRAVRSAATAVSGELSHPDVVAASARLRTIAREVGMTDEEIEALIRNVGRGAVTGTHAANAVGAALDTTAPLTDDVADALARQLGVPRIRRTGEATRTVGVAPTMVDGRVVVDEIVAGDLATVGDVLAHAETVARVKRYDGIVGKVRETWDALAEAVGAAPRMNPHTPFTAAHEAFEEVRKYEAMLRRRIGDLAAELGRGGDDAAKAAARIEDEILVMEGELAHYREVLDEVKHTGDLGAARGLIEAKDVGKVTDEAIAAGYPALPSDDYFYRRWPGRGPEGQEFQVVRKNTAVDAFQPRKDPATGKWVLGESEEVSRVPKSFAAAMTDDEVVQAMLVESKSAKAIVDALINKVGAVDSDVYARAATAVKKVRTPRGMVTDDVADGVRRVTDEDNLRHALKAEFKEDFFTAASREVTPEAQMKRFRDLTEDLNPADSGNMMEDFLARRDPGSVRHVEVDQGKLAGQKPPVSVTQDRQIDRVRPDGTAIECKSGAGALSERELKQLDDYRTMQAGAIVDVNGTPTTVKQVLYEFTDPAGVVANLDTIANRMLDKGIHVKVYNASGQDRTLTTVDDLGDLLDWLRQ